MTRSLTIGAIAMAIAMAVAACSSEEGHVPTLRKRAPTTDTSPTDPAADASTPAAVDAAPAPPPAIETQIADLDFQVVNNGFGPLERNTSNGEDAAGDGKPITLGGVVYPKGLGVHADSEITVALGGAYKTFIADVGVDDEVEDRGSIVFQVSADGETLFDSGVMTGATETKKVSVSVAGKQELKLVVTNGGDDIGSDHGDWAGARLVR